jgi:hypothetical protein
MACLVRHFQIHTDVLRMQQLQVVLRAVASSNMLSGTGAELSAQCSDEPTGGRAGPPSPNVVCATVPRLE